LRPEGFLQGDAFAGDVENLTPEGVSYNG